MGTIEKFEDIDAWQKARESNQKIYEVSGRDPFDGDFSLKDQIRRASNSIMLNISEGFGRESNEQFRKFLFFAHGSASEVKSALYIALDQQYITKKQFNELGKEIDETSKMISGLISYLADA